MSQQSPAPAESKLVAVPEARPTLAQPAPEEVPARGAGWVFFAALMMIVMGSFDVLQGLAAILRGAFYEVPANYFINVDASTWGWFHLILGTIVVLAGFALFRGSMWARIVGILVAGVSLIVGFAGIPIYPIWALSIMLIDCMVIWALAVHGRVLTTE